MKSYHTKYLYISVLLAVVFLSGCAARAPYFRLDTSLQKEIRAFNGSDYISLARICDFYSLDYKYDSFAQTAVVSKGSNRIVFRAGSELALFNAKPTSIGAPVTMSGNALFIPLSFVKSNMGPVIGYYAPPEISPDVEEPRKFSIKSIVLDPGHGGKDPGAIGRRSRVKEKDLTLQLTRKLKSILESAGIKVIMTRSSDVFIPLPKRSEIANKSSADLFVSMHINASRSRAMRGFECYYLSNATDDNARAIEAFENSSLRMDEGASAQRSRPLDKTLWDMTLTENRIESSELAGHICDSVDGGLTMGSRGVKRARFYVLKHTNIPAVLVEAGYLSNKYEELKLRDPEFLDRLAESIARGILKYKKEYERTEGFTRL